MRVMNQRPSFKSSALQNPQLKVALELKLLGSTSMPASTFKFTISHVLGTFCCQTLGGSRARS